MNKKLVKSLVLVTRLCGILALAFGCIYTFGGNLPLACHIAPGALTLLALLALSAIAYRRAPLRSLSGITIALLTAVMGLAQNGASLASSEHPLGFMLGHVLLGISAIALAEMLAKRLRAGVTSEAIG